MSAGERRKPGPARAVSTPMARAIRIAACTALLAGTPARSETPEPGCELPGEVVQWIADYCLLALQTDDEIAAADCIGEHLARRFPSACAAKAHYKRAMCGRLAAGGAPGKSIEDCVADPEFMGRAVRGGGLGG